MEKDIKYWCECINLLRKEAEVTRFSCLEKTITTINDNIVQPMLDNEIEHKEELEKLYPEMTEQIATLTKDLKNSEESRIKKIKEFDSLYRERIEQNKEIDKLKGQVNDIYEQYNDMCKNYSNVCLSDTKLKEDNKQLKEENIEIKKQFDLTQNLMKKMQEEYSQLLSNHTDLQKKYDEIKLKKEKSDSKEKSDLEEEVKAANRAENKILLVNSNLMIKISELKKENKRLEELVKQSHIERDAVQLMKKEHMDLAVKYTELKDKYNKLLEEKE